MHAAADLMAVRDLSPEDIDALAPVSCHALFCLGALAYWEGRLDEAEPLLAHAWSHGGDSIPHLWSLVNYALVQSSQGSYDAALEFETAAYEMAVAAGRRPGAAGDPQQPGLHAAPARPAPGGLRRVRRPAALVLADDVPDVLLTSAEDFACVLFDMGRDRDGALLLGAAVAERDAVGVPRMAFQEAELEPSVTAARARLGGDWDALLERGAELGVLAAVASAIRRELISLAIRSSASR